MKDIFCKIRFFLLFLLGLFAACSDLPISHVFSQRAIAEPFVAELNGSVTQTIVIHHNANSQIAWAKLTEARDFKYFQIERVTSNGTVIVQDGIDDFVANSRAQVPAFTVNATEAAQNDFTNSGLNVSTQDGVQFQIRFAPQVAPPDADTPFQATLEIYYTAPEEGVYLINLQGYVQGIRSDKCTQNISSYEVHEYEFVNNQFGFYMCSPEVAATNNANAPDHGASTNFAQMPISGNFYFYQPDDETVCIMHAGNSAAPENASLPDFDFLIPAGLADVSSIPITLFSTAECSVSPTDGSVFCDDNLQLDTLISISRMTATSGAVAAEDLITSQCPDFNSISGVNGIDDDSMSLVIYGSILRDAITESYNIVDALILGVIDLQKI